MHICTVLLPPGGYPIAVKYIISYHIDSESVVVIFHISCYLCCSVVICVFLCIVCVHICTVLLPPGGYPIAVKYIISYHIDSQSLVVIFHISSYLCCSVVICVFLCIVCVYMCTELLPSGGYPIAVKYIISYHIDSQSLVVIFHISCYLCCSVVICVFLCIVCVYTCTELLPSGGYPIAVKYIISYHIDSQSLVVIFHISCYLCCSVVICVFLCIVCVYMCTATG